MNYLKYEIDAGPTEVIEVILDHAANVQLMDLANFSNYTAGRLYRYFGGYVKQTPFHIQPPHQGHWYVIIDLGGYPGSVRASVQLIGPNVLGRTG
jgi:hypothetical protein